jgi:hypothetical protein
LKRGLPNMKQKLQLLADDVRAHPLSGTWQSFRQSCFPACCENRRFVTVPIRLVLVNTTTNLKITAFWNIAPCSLVEVYRRFRRTYCLHHRDYESLWNVGILQRDYAAVYPRMLSTRIIIFASVRIWNLR